MSCTCEITIHLCTMSYEYHSEMFWFFYWVIVSNTKGPLSYVVETEEKLVWCKHAEQLKVLGGEDAKRDSAQPDDSALHGLSTRDHQSDKCECRANWFVTFANTEGASHYPTRERPPPVRLGDELTWCSFFYKGGKFDICTMGHVSVLFTLLYNHMHFRARHYLHKIVFLSCFVSSSIHNL